MVKTYYRHSREKLNVRTFSRMFFSNLKKRKLLIFSLIALLVILPVSYLVLENRSSVEAAWMNDNWGFRKAIAIPSHSTLETNVYVIVPTFDATDTSKFQADCGDLRFTKQNGEQLPYFVVDCDATANIHVQFDSLPADASTYYMYYGNASAQNGFSSSDFSTAATGLGSQALAAEEKSPAPVAYWKFDEGYGTTAKDSTVNANNGTFGASTAAPIWQTEDQCISGKCLYFDGTNDVVSVPNSTSLQITGNQTIIMWLKPIQFGVRRNPIAKAYGGEGTITFEPANNLNYYWGTGGGNTTPYESKNSSAGLILNQWNQIILVRNITANTITWYINGRQTSQSAPGYAAATASALPLTIGNGYAGAFMGFIDDVKLYNYARSAAQIKADIASKGTGSIKGASVSMGSNSKNSDALSDGLVGYWKQDEATWSGTLAEVIDSSGNANHGQAMGAAGGKTYPTTGKFGNGGYFDGVDDYMNIPTSTVNNYTSNGTFSLSVWVKPSTLTSSWRRGIILQEAYLTTGYRLGLDNGGAPRFWTDQSGGTLAMLSSTAMTINQWNHIVVTYDNQQAYLYLNGIRVGSAIGTYLAGTNTLRMGAPVSEYFGGNLDEFRSYNRALSPVEINKLYSFAPGPLAYYNFEEGSGAAANDSSGNSYSGVLNGSPTWTSGQYGKSLSFADSSQDVTISGMTGQLSKTLTVEAWVDYQGINTDGFDRVIARGWVGDGWLLGVWDSAGTDKTFCSIAQGGVQYGVTATTITPGKYHLALTYDGTALKCYVNGVYTGENTNIPNAAFDTSSNIKIADVLTNNIKIDDVRIYNYARTSGQIIEDMNGGHPLGGSPVGSQVGYWKFDEGYGITANNSGSGGTTLNGTITGTPWTNNGRINKALQLNGSSNYISIPDNSSINPTTSFTVSTWIKPTILANNTNYNIFAKENWGAFLGYRLFLGGYGGCVDKNCLTGSVSNGTTRVSTPSTLYLTDINSWHHVTLVYSSTTLKMYLDGVLKSTTDSTTVSTISNTPLAASIGRHSSGGEFFPGVIDEVKYYSAALTADEIKLDYNRGSAMVLGTMSDTSGLSGGSIASSSASSAYCVPGDSISCSPPVGEWNFEEASYTNNCSTATVFDTSTNGLNLLSCPNGTGPTSKVVGKKGSAAYLDGVNDELNSTSTNLDLTGEITTQAWVKITDVTNASDPEILNKSNNNAGYALEIGFSSRNPKFRIGNGTAYSVLSGTSVLQNNVWYFITGTLSSGGVQKIYVNGRQENSTTITGSLAAAVGQTFRLGVRGAGTYLNGAIDEAKIYNYARTPAQIAWDFNKGKPIGWWKLDECQGTTINDSSGNGYSGTLTIGATGTNTSAGTCTGSAGEAWKDGQIGRYNSGLDVDGTDDNGSIAGLSSFSFNSFTTSAWVKPSSGATSRIFSQQSGATVWLMGVSGSQLSYNGSDDGGLITMGPDIVSDGQWHHVAITRDTTNTLITFYVDGKNVGTTASGPNSYVIAAALSLFRHAGSDTQYYTGQVDDLRIYNYPLTSTQIKQVYNNGAVSFAPATGSP